MLDLVCRAVWELAHALALRVEQINTVLLPGEYPLAVGAQADTIESFCPAHQLKLKRTHSGANAIPQVSFQNGVSIDVVAGTVEPCVGEHTPTRASGHSGCTAFQSGDLLSDDIPD